MYFKKLIWWQIRYVPSVDGMTVKAKITATAMVNTCVNFILEKFVCKNLEKFLIPGMGNEWKVKPRLETFYAKEDVSEVHGLSVICYVLIRFTLLIVTYILLISCIINVATFIWNCSTTKRLLFFEVFISYPNIHRKGLSCDDYTL